MLTLKVYFNFKLVTINFNYTSYLIVGTFIMVCLQKFLYSVFTFLCIKSVTSNLFNGSISNTFFVYEKLNNVLSHCFPNNSNFLIITKQIDQMFLPFNFSDFIKSIILINNEFQSKSIYQHYPESATFVFVVDSVDEFENIITILNTSIWWNYDSKYIIIRSKNVCNDALNILKVAWDYRLLVTTYLCINNLTNNITLYTYNPFTNRAPRPWVIVNNSNKSNESWTLFERTYKDNENCVDIIYDKTKFMDGYGVKAIAIPQPDTIWHPKILYNISSLEKRINNKEYNLIKALMHTWNITINVRFAITYFTVEKDDYDFLLTPLFRITWDRDVTVPIYPFETTSIVIITQKRSFLTPQDKIISFYSRGIILSTIVVYITTIIILIINKRQRFTTAALEIMRLMVYCGIQQPLLNLPIRIYFFGVFWLVVIINATFQGNLATFLTKPERIYIESLEDLKNYKYDVYTYPQVHYNFEESFSSMEISQILHINGYQVVTNNSKAAYIIPDARGYPPAFKYQLHVSKPILRDYISMATCKEKFPFIKKIDDVTSKCFESGLLWFWDDQQLYKFKSNLSNTEELETQLRFRPITLVDLAFAFKLFAIGISCSASVFVIEVICSKITDALFSIQGLIKLYFFSL